MPHLSGASLSIYDPFLNMYIDLIALSGLRYGMCLYF